MKALQINLVLEEDGGSTWISNIKPIKQNIT